MGVIRRKDGTVAARFSDLSYPSYWPTFDQSGRKYIAWEQGCGEPFDRCAATTHARHRGEGSCQ